MVDSSGEGVWVRAGGRVEVFTEVGEACCGVLARGEQATRMNSRKIVMSIAVIFMGQSFHGNTSRR